MKRMKKEKKENEKKISKVEEAQKTLQEETKRRANSFLEEYKKLCSKHGFELVPDTRITIAPLQKK